MHLTKFNISLSFLLIFFLISLSSNSSPEYHLLSHYPTYWIVPNVFAGSEDDEDSERSDDDQEDEEEGEQGPREDFVPNDGDQGPREDFVPNDGDREEESDDRETRNDFPLRNYRPPPSVEPQDFCSRDLQFSTPNEKLIISDLINLDSNSIRNYPYLMSLPFIKIKTILHCLDPYTLLKVLLNIPENDLIKIYYGITSREFNQILNRLLPSDEMQIKYRLFQNSPFN